MTGLPEKFDSLAAGEEQIRAISKAAIEASDDMSLHARVIEQSMSALDLLARRHAHVDDDDLTIKILAARLFNSSASAMRLLMTGYYQSSVMPMRDLLETTFLFDFFRTFPDQIAVWRQCDERKRHREFGAMRIRMALDDRDGFTERKREAAYNLLCELGTHLTYEGFRMLMAGDTNLINIGPFFETKSFEMTLYELAKLMMQAGSQARRFITESDVHDYRATIECLQCHADWSEKFLGGTVDRGRIAEIQAILDEVVRRGGLMPPTGG